MESNQKKTNEIKPENSNKEKNEKMGLKKKEEGPQKSNENCHTNENEYRKKNQEYIDEKIKKGNIGKKNRKITPEKARVIKNKKVANNKLDNLDKTQIIRSRMSFRESFKNEKQNPKKEENQKEVKKPSKISKKPLIKNIDKSLNKNHQEIEAIFTYNARDTTIQAYEEDKMKDIINKFTEKSGVKKENVFFIYNGGQINENFSFTQQANGLDNNRKKINILVSDINNNYESQKSEIISNNFICPECYENIILNITDYKINYKCKNNHTKNQMMLNEFEQLQKIDLTKIKCGQCENCTKSETFNNEFFYCFDCKKNICPLCKNSHEQKHKIFNYDDKNYNCEKHNEQFIEYCQKCGKNLCFLCKNEHIEHKDIINLQSIIIPKEEILNRLKNTEILIDEIKRNVEDIKNKLNNFVKNLDILHKINKNFIDNYNVKNRNYEILQNLKEIHNNNKFLIKELQSITTQEFLINKINNILLICNKISIKNGQIIYQNGDKYIGELKNNQRNGHGILYYNPKDDEGRFFYDGDWKDDKREGNGIIYWKNNDVYKGNWKDDKAEGKGIFYYDKGDIYDGDWKNNKKEGKGNCSFFNGNKYEGDWINNTIEGTGIFYWNNGSKYIGNFKNGNFDGKGVLFYENGNIEVGVYSNGKKSGKYALLDSDGKISIKKV